MCTTSSSAACMRTCSKLCAQLDCAGESHAHVLACSSSILHPVCPSTAQSATHLGVCSAPHADPRTQRTRPQPRPAHASTAACVHLPACNADGALCNCGQHLINLHDLGDVLGHVQALKASVCQQGGAAVTLLQLAQTGLHTSKHSSTTAVVSAGGSSLASTAARKQAGARSCSALTTTTRPPACAATQDCAHNHLCGIGTFWANLTCSTTGLCDINPA